MALLENRISNQPTAPSKLLKMLYHFPVYSVLTHTQHIKLIHLNRIRLIQCQIVNRFHYYAENNKIKQHTHTHSHASVMSCICICLYLSVKTQLSIADNTSYALVCCICYILKQWIEQIESI